MISTLNRTNRIQFVLPNQGTESFPKPLLRYGHGAYVLRWAKLYACTEKGVYHQGMVSICMETPDVVDSLVGIFGWKRHLASICMCRVMDLSR